VEAFALVGLHLDVVGGRQGEQAARRSEETEGREQHVCDCGVLQRGCGCRRGRTSGDIEECQAARRCQLLPAINMNASRRQNSGSTNVVSTLAGQRRRDSDYHIDIVSQMADKINAQFKALWDPFVI
jgi:hypothetical protein